MIEMIYSRQKAKKFIRSSSVIGYNDDTDMSLFAYYKRPVSAVMIFCGFMAIAAVVYFIAYFSLQEILNPPSVSFFSAVEKARGGGSPETALPAGTMIPAVNSEKTNSLEWGAYAGWKKEDIVAFERTVGKTPDIVAAFVHFGNENTFPEDIGEYVKSKNKTLAIFWEATDYTAGTPLQPKFSYDAILRGDWDGYMRSFANDAKAYGGPVILIPFSEMNGDWYPWSGTMNGNTPEKAVLAYRHVYDIFSTVPNVKFGWAVNHESVPDTTENSVEAYYPGDAYVDYVGVDGFNFGGEEKRSFIEVFGHALAVLSRYDKPIYIFSMATAENEEKAAWIIDAFSVQIPKYPGIAGWIWFNENKEKDWRVDSNSAALSAFKAILPV